MAKRPNTLDNYFSKKTKTEIAYGGLVTEQTSVTVSRQLFGDVSQASTDSVLSEIQIHMNVHVTCSMAQARKASPQSRKRWQPL